jgi:ribosomal protein S20
MPNIKSQKDRVVQAKKETLRNKAIKTNMKTVIKKANAATAAGDGQAETKTAVTVVMKAAQKGVLHKNTASRKVSKLMKNANKANA